jgi:predicted outer membrane repeat protein
MDTTLDFGNLGINDDTKKLYFGSKNGNIDASNDYIGICETAASAAAKTVDIAYFALYHGVRVSVMFTIANSASAPTLNVSGKGAYGMRYNGAAISGADLPANKYLDFKFDGTYWQYVGGVLTGSEGPAGPAGADGQPGADGTQGSSGAEAEAIYFKEADGSLLRAKSGSIVYINDTTFLQNNATTTPGGAAYVENGATVYQDNISGAVRNNAADGDGGGVYLLGVWDNINGNFVYNSSGGNGGAFYLGANCQLTLR